jgi:hypothetical protein
MQIIKPTPRNPRDQSRSRADCWANDFHRTWEGSRMNAESDSYYKWAVVVLPGDSAGPPEARCCSSIPCRPQSPWYGG